MFPRVSLRVLLPALLFLLSVAPASAASARLTVSSQRVRAGYGVTVYGAHFRPGAYVAILFAYPKAGKHAFERFVGNARTNMSGSFSLQVQVPRLGSCGSAMLYGQVVGTTDFVGRRVSLVGCKHISPPAKPRKP